VRQVEEGAVVVRGGVGKDLGAWGQQRGDARVDLQGFGVWGEWVLGWGGGGWLVLGAWVGVGRWGWVWHAIIF